MAEEAERRYRELGSPSMVAHTVEGRALIELDAGELDAAAPFLREAVARFAGASNLGCTAHALEAVAVWTAARGDRRAAAELVSAAEMLRDVSGAGHKPWEARARYGDYDASVLGDTDDAQEAIAARQTPFTRLSGGARRRVASLVPSTCRRRPREPVGGDRHRAARASPSPQMTPPSTWGSTEERRLGRAVRHSTARSRPQQAGRTARTERRGDDGTRTHDPLLAKQVL